MFSKSPFIRKQHKYSRNWLVSLHIMFLYLGGAAIVSRLGAVCWFQKFRSRFHLNLKEICEINQYSKLEKDKSIITCSWSFEFELCCTGWLCWAFASTWSKSHESRYMCSVLFEWEPVFEELTWVSCFDFASSIARRTFCRVSFKVLSTAGRERHLGRGSSTRGSSDW